VAWPVLPCSTGEFALQKCWDVETNMASVFVLFREEPFNYVGAMSALWAGIGYRMLLMKESTSGSTKQQNSPGGT
jgi:hypothetical protein